MRIPSSSEILINGVTPVTLAFASVLSANGIRVLLIDDQSEIKQDAGQLIVGSYSLMFLKDHGFNFNEEEIKNNVIDAAAFINQALKLLANNLCSVIWETKIVNSVTKDHAYQLSHQEQTLNHTSHYFYHSSDFQFGDSSLDLRNIFLLAWRLIGVLKGKLKDNIIASYLIESQLIKEQFLANAPSIKPHFFQRLINSYIHKNGTLNLIESKISLHLSQNRNLQAGEFLPDFTFYDEKTKLNSSLHQWTSYQHFSVIILGSLIPTNLFAIAKWLQMNYPIQLYYLPYSEKNQPVFNALQLRAGEKKTLIVRPDKYIGLIHDAIDIDIMDNYLRNFIFMNEKASDSESTAE